MNKLAIFVEGYTEAVFAERLVEEVAERNQVHIEHWKIRGGGRKGVPRSLRIAQGSKSNSNQEYYVMIIDCGGDSLVKERVLEEHQNLTSKGFTKILCIRDVRPSFSHAEIHKLEAGLRLYIKTSLIPVEFYLAIMEIEAWFLAEISHFHRIDPLITLQSIVDAFHFNPSQDDLELRASPAADLENCYALGSKSYQKNQVRQTVEALDIATMYLWPITKFRHLHNLFASIELFLRRSL